ncbi:MAG: preprotein translocase subunit SecY [Lachnospiraceae bacterium]|nr:preprotein translocase subunit SecY [Clostridia bacterium]MCQ2541034.1 preprotein translocase subunit SecY [Lachnospiraceae bacterium]
MFKTFIKALKLKDVRSRLLFTFAMLVVIRIGCQLPIPGVNRTYFAQVFASKTGDAFNFFDAFTGGSFTNMSIFALNITPYITSSIIMQLLTIAIPKLEEMNKEEDGRKKIASITRFVTVGLALFESAAMAIGFGNQGLLDASNYNVLNIVTIIVALTAGSAFLMWIGERITEHGVGNGISIVLVINIISRIPVDIAGLYKRFIEPANNVGEGVIKGIIILAIILVTVVIVVLLNGGIRKIPVQYAKKVQGNRIMGGNTANIPLRVNTAGVIPIIFASSLMQTPIIFCQLLNIGNGTGIGSEILRGLSSSHWFDREQPIYTLGLLFYIILVIFFAYFYTAITFNPMIISDNMKKSGGFIPGIRPGKPTTEYLNSVLHYIIFMGAVGLIIVAVIPIFFSGVFSVNVTFGGTSLIIIVSVVLETIKQVETLMLQRNYKGFLNS